MSFVIPHLMRDLALLYFAAMGLRVKPEDDGEVKPGENNPLDRRALLAMTDPRHPALDAGSSSFVS